MNVNVRLVEGNVFNVFQEANGALRLIDYVDPRQPENKFVFKAHPNEKNGIHKYDLSLVESLMDNEYAVVREALRTGDIPEVLIRRAPACAVSKLMGAGKVIRGNSWNITRLTSFPTLFRVVYASETDGMIQKLAITRKFSENDLKEGKYGGFSSANLDWEKAYRRVDEQKEPLIYTLTQMNLGTQEEAFFTWGVPPCLQKKHAQERARNGIMVKS